MCVCMYDNAYIKHQGKIYCTALIQIKQKYLYYILLLMKPRYWKGGSL